MATITSMNYPPAAVLSAKCAADPACVYPAGTGGVCRHHRRFFAFNASVLGNALDISRDLFDDEKRNRPALLSVVTAQKLFGDPEHFKFTLEPARDSTRRATVGAQLQCCAYERCRREFLSLRSGHEYCSSLCWRRARRPQRCRLPVLHSPVTKACACGCGEAFSTMRPYQRFATERCRKRWASRGRLTTLRVLACCGCGTGFITNHGRQLYCTPECYRVTRLANKRAATAAGHHEIACACGCGTRFTPIVADTRFASNRCYQRWWSRQHRKPEYWRAARRQRRELATA